METLLAASRVDRYAQLVQLSKETAAKLKELREEVLEIIPAGDSMGTKYGTVSHVTTESLIVDDSLVNKLKALGHWARVRKTTADTSKVRALAKVDGGVRRFLKFKAGSRIDVRS